jgi:hypothetical protein
MSKKTLVVGVLSVVLSVAAGVSYGLHGIREPRNSAVVVSSIIISRSVDELAANSYAAVIGIVEGTEVVREKSAIRPDAVDIVTIATIKVDKYLTNPNNLSAPQVKVKTLGGMIGEESMVAEGEPKFVTGTRVVVFLNKLGENEFSVYGAAQGKFTINEDGTLGTEGERPFISTVFDKETMTISELESQIAAVAK